MIISDLLHNDSVVSQPTNTSNTDNDICEDDNRYHSTLKRRQQSWVDPLEARIQDTFYHNNLKTLRPKYSELLSRSTTNYSIATSLFQPSEYETSTNSEIPSANEESDEELVREEAELLQKTKFNTFNGVIARCLLKLIKYPCVFYLILLFLHENIHHNSIFGVILFLRMGFVVAEAGILLTIVVILACSTVTFITTLSMSAIATNGRIMGGGLYYMISRSLGASFGGTVGILFGTGNAIATSLYLIGFAETIVLAIGEPFITGNYLWDIRIWANIALCMELILLIAGGMKLVMRLHMTLLIFISLVIAFIFIGSFYQKNSALGILGMAGFANGNFTKNLDSDFVTHDGIKYDFFKILALFFPACTGIMAGANISSQLKNPSKNIPKGTLTAISITTTIYIFLTLILGAIVTRHALLTNILIMKYVSVYGPLFLIGVFAASLSAALTSLTSAPQILQAVINDNIMPVFDIFCIPGTHADGKLAEVEIKKIQFKRINIVCILIVFGCNLIGSLNAIAPLITDFYLIAYCTINYSCFLSSVSKSPGWRPSFIYYNKYVAFFGSVLCIVFMVLSDWMYAIGAIFVAFCIYQYIEYIEPDVNWGQVQESREYYNAYQAVLKLHKSDTGGGSGSSSASILKSSSLHVKHWRPGFLILCGDPLHRPHLIHFANTLSKSHGPTFFATICCPNVTNGDNQKSRKSNDLQKQETCSLYRTNVRKFHASNYSNYLPIHLLNINKKGFFESVFSSTFRNGSQILMQTCGLGNLRPNTLILGYRHNWKLDMKQTYEYIEIIRDALEMGYGVLLLRNFSFIHWSLKHFVEKQSTTAVVTDNYCKTYTQNYQQPNMKTQTKTGNRCSVEMMKNINIEISAIASDDELEKKTEDECISDFDCDEQQNTPLSPKICAISVQNTSIDKCMSTSSLNINRSHSNKQYIDVWWLIDDGGLTVLLPHLMKLHTFWQHCKLRLNIICSADQLSDEYLHVCHLMKQFRLPYEKPNLIEIPVTEENPTQATIERFLQLTDHEIDINRDLIRVKVIMKWLKVAELLHEYSLNSGVVFVTLPLPTRFYNFSKAKKSRISNEKKSDGRKGEYMNGKIYFAILEMLTENMPPTIVMRGNGESALTFYSE